MSFTPRARRRLAAAAAAVAVVAVSVPIVAAAPAVAVDAPVVTLEDGINGCNGVLPTPGSENTTKRLDPDFPSDFNAGGVVGYVIDYPVDPTDVAGRTTFVITDCVFVTPPGATKQVAIAKYLVSFVPNTTDFRLRFSVPIPADTVLGSEFCNYAKTTAAPSESQASNRKAGPACFIVGGALRIEKRSGSVTGPLLPGASFTVVCTPATTTPPTIITGLSSPSATLPNGTVAASGVSTEGSIAINGPSGTPCTVTETAAPPGYQIDPTPRTLTIPVGTSQTVNVFVNVQLGSLSVSKQAVGGAGTFHFVVDCTGTAFDTAFELVVAAGATVSRLVSDAIPVGTACTVTETANAAFDTVSVPPDGQVTIGLTPSLVAFTNTRRTGDLVVRKASDADGTFSFDVDCDGTAFDRIGAAALTIPTVGGVGSASLTGIPTGTTCTVTEHANPLFSSVVIPDGGQVVIVTGDNVVGFTNTRNVAPLRVVKTADVDGTFVFDVDCDGTAFDRVITLTTVNGQASEEITGIPTTTSCTVTERPNPHYSSTSNPADGTVLIGNDGGLVSFANVRLRGALVINKATDSDGTFRFDVDCTGTEFDRVGPDALAITTANGTGSVSLTGIPTGTTCTVTEQDDPLFTVTVTPGNGQVVIGATDAVVSFVNTRRLAALRILKTSDVDGTFVFDVDCDGTAFDRVVTLTTVGGEASEEITGIPTTTVCTVTERPNPLYSSVSSPADGVVLIGDLGGTVSFANIRLRGALLVLKASDADGTFVFDVDCAGTEFDRLGPDALTITTAGGAGSATVTGIPTGTSCTVTERSNPLFSSVVTPGDGTVSIAVGDNVVAFTNTRLLGALRIVKTSDVDGTFVFDVDCDGTAHDRLGDNPVVITTVGGTGLAELPGIPTTTACTVTERPNPLFTSTSSPADGAVVVGNDGATVTFANLRIRGALVITKVTNDGSGVFTFEVDCDGTEFDRLGTNAIGIATTGEVRIDGIPTGTTCVVTEAVHRLFVSTVTPGDGTAVIGAGDNVVAFVNTARVAGLALEKVVDRADAATGDTLTYSFVATTTGNLDQTGVVVTDTLPPNTTYVPGSAACAAPCVASFDAATETVTWLLGDLAAGVTVGGLTFKVTVDRAAAGTRILNDGDVESEEVGPTKSNEVRTLIANVRRTVIRRPPPAVLPRTGGAVAGVQALLIAALLLAAGVSADRAGARMGRGRGRYVPRHGA